MPNVIKRFLNPSPALRALGAPLVPAVRAYRPRRERKISQAYDNMADLLTGSVVVRIPEIAGVFEIDCRSHLAKRILTTRQYEPEVEALIRTYIDPQRDAIDVGANVGIFTVLMASLLSGSSRVLALEPTPSAGDLLRKNLVRNGCTDRVIVFDGAATQAAGTFTIETIPGLEEYSSLGQIAHYAVENEKTEILSVEGESVDSLVRRLNLHPGLIKIDTEGSEFQVLTGAVDTLRLHRPIIVSELFDPMLRGHGATADMVIATLRAENYTVTRYPFPEILAIPYEVSTLLERSRNPRSSDAY